MFLMEKSVTALVLSWVFVRFRAFVVTSVALDNKPVRERPRWESRQNGRFLTGAALMFPRSSAIAIALWHQSDD